MDNLDEELLDELGDLDLLDEDFLGSLEESVSSKPEDRDISSDDSDYEYDQGSDYLDETDSLEDTEEHIEEYSENLNSGTEVTKGIEDVEVLDLDLDKAEEMGETVVSAEDTYSNSVERYTATHTTYPCIALCGVDTLPSHTLQAVRKMIDSSRSSNKSYDFYYQSSDQNQKLGTISSKQVKALVELVGRDNLKAYFSKGFVLEDDLIYTLCD